MLYAFFLASSALLAGPDGRCTHDTGVFTIKRGQPEWLGWGGSERQQRFQSAQNAQLAADDIPKLKLKWSFGFAGASQAYSQPSVIGAHSYGGLREPRSGRRRPSISGQDECTSQPATATRTPWRLPRMPSSPSSSTRANCFGGARPLRTTLTTLPVNSQRPRTATAPSPQVMTSTSALRPFSPTFALDGTR